MIVCMETNHSHAHMQMPIYPVFANISFSNNLGTVPESKKIASISTKLPFPQTKCKKNTTTTATNKNKNNNNNNNDNKKNKNENENKNKNNNNNNNTNTEPPTTTLNHQQQHWTTNSIQHLPCFSITASQVTFSGRWVYWWFRWHMSGLNALVRFPM